MSAIDPRIAKRRQLVAEHGARRRLKMTIILGIIVCLLGLGWWATQSELLDIDAVVVGPATHVDVQSVLARSGLTEGVSLVSAILSADEAEKSLESNPWVRAATVSVLFPGTIEVEVIERTPAAVVATQQGWALIAADLTILEAAEGPSQGLGAIADEALIEPGMTFLAELGSLAEGVELSLVDGDVWAVREGTRALLGRPTDMRAKAASFAAMLGEEIPEGWGINLVAPSRPALFKLTQP